MRGGRGVAGVAAGRAGGACIELVYKGSRDEGVVGGAGMRRAGGIAGAWLHLCVDLGEGLRELGLEAADLRLHRVEDVLVHLGGDGGCEWRCEMEV